MGADFTDLDVKIHVPMELNVMKFDIRVKKYGDGL